MVKNVLKTLLTSIFILFLSSCDIPHTFSRKKIESAIKDICHDEFNLKVEVWDVGNTVWIYAPMVLMDEKGGFRIDDESKWDEDVLQDMRRINESINRVFRSIDDRPEFYCLIKTNIDNFGMDWYSIVFLQDQMNYHMESQVLGLAASPEKFNDRIVYFNFSTPKALNDQSGEHIKKYEISMNEYIALLAQRRMLSEFTDPEVKDNFQIDDLNVSYSDNKLTIVFEILVEKYKVTLPKPLEEAEKIARDILEAYAPFTTINEIHIEDNFNIKSKDISLPNKIEVSKDRLKTSDDNSGLLLKLYKANFYFFRAMKDYQEKEYRAAQDLFIKSIEAYPEFINGYIYLAQTYNFTKNYTEAIKFYKKVIAKHSSEITAYVGLGQAYISLKDFNKAKEVLDKALEIDQTNIYALQTFHFLYLGEGEYEKALGYLKRALKGDHSNSQKRSIYTSIASVYLLMKKTAMAITYYDKALEAATDDIDKKAIYRRIADTYMATKEYKLAKINYQKLLSYNEEDPEIYANLGSTAFYSADYDNAFIYYEKALEIDPDILRAHIGLGYSWRAIKDFDKAIISFEKALALDPESADAYLELAICYGELDNYGKSLEFFNKSLELDSKNPRMHYSRGKVYTDMMQLEKAEADFRKAIEIKDNYAEAYYGLGFTFYNSKEYEKAKKYFEKAKQLYIVQENMESARIMNEYLNQLP